MNACNVFTECGKIPSVQLRLCAYSNLNNLPYLLSLFISITIIVRVEEAQNCHNFQQGGQIVAALKIF